MNGHCSKDIVTSIVYTYNRGKYFCINILFVLGVCMFDGIAEHEVAEREVAERECFFVFFLLFFFFFFFFFYEIAYLFLFNLFLFNDLI